MRTWIARRFSHSISFGTRSPAAVAFGLEMIPTVLMMGIEQEFLIAFGADNRALDQFGLKTEFAHGPFHPFASGAMQFGVAHDAALSHLALAHFKLRFDQYNHAASRS